MNFIYDILLNFSDQTLYEFYEWYQDDAVEHVRKIPFFKVTDSVFKQLKKDEVIIDKDFLDIIYQQTEIIDGRIISKLDYACLFTNLKEVLAVTFNNKGQSIMKSNLLLDEVSDVIEKGEFLKLIKLKLKIINFKNKDRFLTRREKEVISFLNRELKNIYQAKMIDKLKYLYFECFNQYSDNLEYIYQQLKSFINQEWSNKLEELYKLVKLSYNKKSN